MTNEHTPKVKAVVFDFDGTLANSFPVFVQAIEYVLKRNFTPEEIEDLRQHSTREVIKTLKIKKWRLPLIIARGMKEIDRHQKDITIFPDIVEMLKRLRQQGYRLYIVSSHSSNGISSFLEQYKLSESFDYIYSHVGLFGKPKALKKLLRKFDYRADECAFVGDEVRDIEAAEKVGIQCVACTWGFNTAASLRKHRPSAIIHKPAELAEALVKLS